MKTKLKKTHASLKESIANFSEEKTLEMVRRRVECAEPHALAFLKLVDTTIERTEIAIAEAISAAIEAEKFEDRNDTIALEEKSLE
ncbi:MAG: hypothetical protein AAGB24_13030 [Bacteroidota bacterium]